MSCEVAVMNKRGVALAADSVVTVGPAKVYQTAEKLFQLSFDEPVAVMTYGIADTMGVPWETVFKTYRRKLGSRHFDHLEQYGEDFLRYLESSNPSLVRITKSAASATPYKTTWYAQRLGASGTNMATRRSSGIKQLGVIWPICWRRTTHPGGRVTTLKLPGRGLARLLFQSMLTHSPHCKHSSSIRSTFHRR